MMGSMEDENRPSVSSEGYPRNLGRFLAWTFGGTLLLIGFLGFIGCTMSFAGAIPPKPGCGVAAMVLIPLGSLVLYNAR